MNTYRVRASHCPYSILIDAFSGEEAELFGAVFFLIHRLVDDLQGRFTSEPWNACVEPGEYVTRSSFANIIPQLAALITSARASNAAVRGRRGSHTGSGEAVRLTSAS
jgi:hypothetical protein